MTFEVKIEFSSELGMILYFILIMVIVFALGYIAGMATSPFEQWIWNGE